VVVVVVEERRRRRRDKDDSANAVACFWYQMRVITAPITTTGGHSG